MDLPPYQYIPGIGMGNPPPPPVVPLPTTSSGNAQSANVGSSQAAFIAKYRDAADKISQQTGIPTARILAQAGFESGWNVNPPGGNLFGIKAGAGYQGKSQTLATHEADANGNLVPTQGNFRVYDNPEDSFADWAKVIQGNHKGALAPNLNDAQYASSLQQSGYGTDPNYAAKLHGAISMTRQGLGQDPDGSTVPTGASQPTAVASAAGPAAAAPTTGGLLQPSMPGVSYDDIIAAGQKKQAAAQDANIAKASQQATTQGMGLLSAATTPAPQFQQAQGSANQPQAQASGMPDFVQQLAQARLMQQLRQGGA